MKRIVIFLCCTCAFAAQAEPLGRLFHTPEQRAMLDLARKTAPLNANGEPDGGGASGLTLNGVVTRSDGRRSTWVNGRVEQGVEHPGKPERNQVQVKLPSGAVKLKVGQSYDPATGRVEEGYQRAPAPPEPVAAKPISPKAPAKTPAPEARDDNPEPEQPAAQ